MNFFVFIGIFLYPTIVVQSQYGGYYVNNELKPLLYQLTLRSNYKSRVIGYSISAKKSIDISNGFKHFRIQNPKTNERFCRIEKCRQFEFSIISDESQQGLTSLCNCENYNVYYDNNMAQNKLVNINEITEPLINDLNNNDESNTPLIESPKFINRSNDKNDFFLIKESIVPVTVNEESNSNLLNSQEANFRRGIRLKPKDDYQHSVINMTLKSLKSAYGFYKNRLKIAMDISQNIKRFQFSLTPYNMHDVCIGIKIPNNHLPKRFEVSSFLDALLRNFDIYMKEVRNILTSIKVSFRIINSFTKLCYNNLCDQVISNVRKRVNNLALQHTRLDNMIIPEDYLHIFDKLRCKPFKIYYLQFIKLQ